MLQVREVSAGYGGRGVLRAASLEAALGEIVAIVGPNGSGKSTLLGAIAGLIPISAGTISVAGESIRGLPPWEVHRRGIALLLQGGQVFPFQSVAENIDLGLAAGKTRSAPDGLEGLDSLLESLAPLSARQAGLLSGGERQLLAVALVLLQRPQYLLLDEPSANLAPDLAEKIATALRSYNAASRCGVVLVEQNARFALDLSTRVYRMSAGRLFETQIPPGRGLEEIWELTFGEPPAHF